jgi:hypothetical protein
MATSRYFSTSIIRSGKSFGTTRLARRIFLACEIGQLKTEIIILKESQRLEHLAGIKYGDSSLWWIIAAASGIGWGLQVPPGTLIRIPVNADEVYEYL